jgi:hypothetical protein
VKKASSKHNRINSLVDRAPKTLLPLLAVGGSLAAGPAAAIELGDATVQSQLGQPLRASIAFALAPKEQVSESCISLGPGQSGLPGIGRASISIANGALLLRGSTPIREPMVATNVVISCPSAARLTREYMMFIDPVGITAAEPAVVAQPTAAARPAAIPAPAPAHAASTRRSTSTERPRLNSPRTTANINREPIGMATRYRVQPGDSLSEITARIKNRPPGLWAAVNTVFEANPDAFIDNDPNKLKAGSWLTIPSFDGSEPIIASAVRTTARAVVADVAPATNVAEVAATTSPAALPEPVQPPVPVVNATTDLQPADLGSGNDNAGTMVEVAANETIDIPDTALVSPETLSTSPNVTTATVQPRAEQATSSWVLWLAGSGVAIILALLLFGRSLRNRFGPTSDYLKSELPMREASPEPDALELRDDVDYPVGNDEQTIECATLDADLLMGTGLHQTIEVDPAKDVGFPSPTEVDIELSFAAELETAEGDDKIRSARLSADETILDSEILPGSEDYPDPEDFDMSVVLDATKMPQPEDSAESTLEAIEMDSQTDTVAVIELDDELKDGSTFDLTILEQDYEDELSATQSLHMDVTQAALMLSAEMEGAKNAATSDDAGSDDDETAAMSLAGVTDFGVNTQFEADNDDAITINDELTFDDQLTIHLSDNEETVEMPIADNDKTREMPAKGANLKKKAG